MQTDANTAGSCAPQGTAQSGAPDIASLFDMTGQTGLVAGTSSSLVRHFAELLARAGARRPVVNVASMLGLRGSGTSLSYALPSTV